MHNSKLIKLLKHLSPKEFKDVRKLVQSPIYTTNPQLTKLYNYLKSCYPDFTASKLAKEKVYQHILKPPYNDLKMRVLMREMTKLIEQYYILLQVRKKEYDQRKLLTAAYGDRGMADLFEKSTNQLLANLEELPYRDEIFYNERYWLLYNRLDRVDVHDKQEKRAMILQLQKRLNIYHEIASVKLVFAIKNIEKLYAYDQDATPQESSPNNLKILYLNLIQLLETKNDDLYLTIKEQFFEQHQQFRATTKEEIFGILNNHLVQKLAFDDQHYNTQLFELYKLGLDHKILISNDRIANHLFLNILISSTKAKQFDWAKTFIDQYESSLQSDTKSDIICLGKAFLDFYQNNFTQTIDILNDNQFSHPLHAITARILSLKSYFELFRKDTTYHELVLNNCASFERYIRRVDFINTNRIHKYLNFCKILKQLVNPPVGANNSDAHKKQLLNDLENNRPINSMAWLKEKIESL